MSAEEVYIKDAKNQANPSEEELVEKYNKQTLEKLLEFLMIFEEKATTLDELYRNSQDITLLFDTLARPWESGLIELQKACDNYAASDKQTEEAVRKFEYIRKSIRQILCQIALCGDTVNHMYNYFSKQEAEIKMLIQRRQE